MKYQINVCIVRVYKYMYSDLAISWNEISLIKMTMLLQKAR